MSRGYGKTIFEHVRKLPIIPGVDFSGEIVSTGNGVWNFKVRLDFIILRKLNSTARRSSLGGDIPVLGGMRCGICMHS
jgi:NADPH:quinone reductase-like Zn-dependent oxidoreductase